MVRGLAVVSAFLLSVIAMITLQPDLQSQAPVAQAPTQQAETIVSRDNVNLLKTVPEAAPSELETLISQAMTESAGGLSNETPTIANNTLTPPVAGDVEGMTWAVLRDIDNASGRKGISSGLLSALVTRSLADAPQYLAAGERAYISLLSQEARATH